VLTKPIAVIPLRQIETLRFMLGQTDVPVSITDAPYKVHDKIVVVRGSLKGLEGEVVRCVDNKSELIVRIDILGCASITIDTLDIERAK
ncbi:MAG: transcriptional regulator, partial [Duncaniella sp.]|nr:transcriptional regulator [Duncaniella sp.]